MYAAKLTVITDPRNTDWFWLRTPEPALLIVAAYLMFVYVGPRLMVNRQPLNIRALIVVYNFAMVALSAYMSAEVRTCSDQDILQPRGGGQSNMRLGFIGLRTFPGKSLSRKDVSRKKTLSEF